MHIKNRTPFFGGERDSAEEITDLIITTKLKKVLEKIKKEGIFSRIAEKKTRPDIKKELIKYFNPGTNNRIFCRKKKEIQHTKDRTKDCMLMINRRFLSWGLKLGVVVLIT